MQRIAGKWVAPGNVVAVLAFALGTVWRYLNIFHWHDPREYVYSDMQMYVDMARRLTQPGFVLRATDVIHPPGMSELLAFFLRFDPGLHLFLWLQFSVCALVPLAVGLLGSMAFDWKSGRGALIVTSLYFPFVDYGGYFLTEIYLALTGTLALAAYLGAVRVVHGPTRLLGPARMPLLAALGGLCFSIAVAMKVLALPAILCFGLLHLTFTTGAKRRIKALAFVIFLLGAAPMLYANAARCTRANEGRFCIASNKTASDFLMGHFGRVTLFMWQDPGGPGFQGFGSPSTYQHGYTDKAYLPFLITDSAKNYQYAWAWIAEHPLQALVLSCQHVWDAFGGAHPWPSSATDAWAFCEGSQYLFVVGLLFPALALLLDLVRRRGPLGLLRSTELAVFSPLLGVCASLFMATGEPRYRIPWDGFVIVLAVEFYRRLDLRGRGDAQTA